MSAQPSYSRMDCLVSASAERLQVLHTASESRLPEEWIENMRERADRLEERSQAQYQLGVMYYDGLGVQPDMARGFQYMMDVASSSSANKRDTNLLPSAQYNVGRAYFMGYGVQQSDSEAEKWWSLAGNHGDDPSSVRAQNTLGMFYSRQETFDPNKAFHWTELAAESNHLEAMASLGLLCVRSSNHGDEEGLQWLKRSCVGGCVYGTGLLSHFYFIRKLFSKAAETAFKVSELDDEVSLSPLDCRGVAIGCFVLGRCLQLGQAVTRDDEKALHYYTKATGLDKRVVAELHDLLTHGKV
ncbi:LRP2-binding protein-like isoform X2 [Halichondria panicea]|uniref:LRP2-binding protein-like isoform X2 n=1 Tax=Halichondria panicea TaxID=6063 RepID=UPI00312B61DB